MPSWPDGGAPPHDSRPDVPLDTPLLKDFIDNLAPVWRDTDALTAFMYQGRHGETLSRRRVGVPHAWHLRAHGPAPYAFTLRTSFPPGAAGERQGADRSATSRA